MDPKDSEHNDVAGYINGVRVRLVCLYEDDRKPVGGENSGYEWLKNLLNPENVETTEG